MGLWSFQPSALPKSILWQKDGLIYLLHHIESNPELRGRSKEGGRRRDKKRSDRGQKVNYEELKMTFKRLTSKQGCLNILYYYYYINPLTT